MFCFSIIMTTLERLIDSEAEVLKIIRLPDDLPWVPYQREIKEAPRPYAPSPLPPGYFPPDCEPRVPYEKKEEKPSVIIIDI